MTVIRIIMIVLCLPLIVVGGKEKIQNIETEIPTISFCELIKNTKIYQGKIVRVRATYRVGFEWAELYCADCLDTGEQTWVEFAHKLCRGSKKIKGDRTINVVFVGMLQTGGQYGHFGAYKNQFLVSCVEKAKTLYKDSPTPKILPKKIREQTHCK